MRIIVRISDGKAGHDSQSIGLCNALKILLSENTHEVVEIAEYQSWSTKGWRKGINRHD